MPCLVFMVPDVPTANGPLSVIDCTSGFHSGQVAVSDQIFHTACGLELVSTERSLLAIPSSPFVLRSRRAAAIEKKVYDPGDDEADEVAEIGAAKHRRKGPLSEGLRDEEQRRQQPDDEGDRAAPVPVGRRAEAQRL